MQLYVIISDDTMLILKMEFTCLSLFLFQKQLSFQSEKSQLKSPYISVILHHLQNLNGKDMYMVTTWTINLGVSNSSYSD